MPVSLSENKADHRKIKFCPNCRQKISPELGYCEQCEDNRDRRKPKIMMVQLFVMISFLIGLILVIAA